VLLLPAAVVAQIAVEVTPLRVEIRMGPGGTFTQTVKLTNLAREAVRIHARVDDYYLTRDGTPQFKLADGMTRFSSASWVRVNPADQVVQPGADGTVRFTVTAPAGTEHGGYRAAIMFEFSPPGTDAAARARDVVFRSRVATIIYVTVGAPRAAIDLVDLQFRQAAGQAPWVVATLKNTGRVHARTKGQLVVYDRNGSVVRRITVPDVPVLPESEREVAVALAEEGQPMLPPGQYRLEVRIDVGLPEVLVGETTITIRSPSEVSAGSE
jgi:hypothetical protein